MLIQSLIFDMVMWVMLGLIVGFAARALVRGQSRLNKSMLVIFGVAGAILGGGLGWLIWGEAGETHGASALARIGLAALGAVLIVGVYGLLSRRRRDNGLGRSSSTQL